PLAISDTSTVTLGFHLLQLLRFPVIIADTSAVTALGMRVTRRFALTVADTSTVALSYTVFTPVVPRFPLIIQDTSLVFLGFQNDHSTLRIPLTVPPYAGYPQETEIDVPAWIRYREEQWEEGPWVLPPYALFYPPVPVPVILERGYDQVHHEWLKTHPRPPGPRRMGDNNHRPQSVLQPFVRSKPIAIKTYVNRQTLHRPKPAARNRLRGKPS